MKLLISLLTLLVLSLLLSACLPASDALPTLAPSLMPPTVTFILTVPPTPSEVPTVTAIPSLTPIVPTPIVISANRTTTITLTADQLNAELARRFAAQPILDFAAAPFLILTPGALQVTMSIAPHTISTPQPLTLTLNLSALATTSGSVLDVRAVGLTALNGVTTQQVKRGQTLIANVLETFAQRAAGSASLAYQYVAVSADAITLTVGLP